MFFGKIKVFLQDYLHAIKFYTQMLVYRTPPDHYLGQIDSAKVPVLLIPGVNTKWNFLKPIADSVSLSGHPIHVVKQLGFNRKEIAVSAQLVRAFIDEEGLHNVIILAHSKGGLIGKELLLRHNQDRRVIKVIAIAAPFLGSHLAKNMPDIAIREFEPNHPTIVDHNSYFDVNSDIVSIYGLYDNHVWPTEHSILDGAENIKVETDGHHQILSNPKTLAIVTAKIAEITEQVNQMN